MPITRNEFTSYLDGLLNPGAYPGDDSNNGLQVEGADGDGKLEKVVFAVDASMELFERAAEENADFIFVHHGISWGNSLNRLRRNTAGRIRILFKKDISLYASHLPLDGHPEYGHNIRLANMLGLKDIKSFAEYGGGNIGFAGQAPEGVTVAKLAETLNSKLDTDCRIFGPAGIEPDRVGVISGGGGIGGLNEAERLGFDLYVTGEIPHMVWHYVRESGLAVISAGHYCTEKPGVLAVMEHVRGEFGIECVFVDLPTGL